MTRSIDSRGWKWKVCFCLKLKKHLRKKIHSLSCLTRVYLCGKIETIWIFDPAIKISFLFDFCTDVLLKFCFDGALYKYACFPNGLASAPRIFTKLLKPAYAILWSMGHLNSGYIDDSYLQGDTPAECHKNVTDTITLFTKLGFQIHPEKSVFIPSQKLTFLGFVLDSNAMTVMLTEEKVLGILSICALLLKTQMPTIRQVAEVILSGINTSHL